MLYIFFSKRYLHFYSHIQFIDLFCMNHRKLLIIQIFRESLHAITGKCVFLTILDMLNKMESKNIQNK